MGRTIIAGGSGFVGKHLVAALQAAGHEPTILSRSSGTAHGVPAVAWDGKTLGEWSDHISGARAIINLAGQSIANKRVDNYEQKIRDSRLDSTRVLGEAIQAATEPPPVWINASAMGYYGERGDEVVCEASRPGTDEIAQLCVDWEAAQMEASLPHTRRAAVRIGLVLGKDGGSFPLLLKLTKGFLGGKVGSGQQWMSWIHVEDLARMFVWLLDEPVTGPVNGVSPHPQRNEDFMSEMRATVKRPWSPPAPKPAVKAALSVLGIPSDLATQSIRVRPEIPEMRGFKWQYPRLRDALKDLI